jgi:hypothetical protein
MRATNETVERQAAWRHRASPDLSMSDTSHMNSADVEALVKVLGRRRPSTGGLVAAAPFLDLTIRLRRGRPFIPKGVHRFRTFEESTEWSIRMMARRRKPGRLA